MLLLLSGNVVVSGAGTVPQESVYNYLKSIEIIGAGSDLIHSVTGPQAIWLGKLAGRNGSPRSTIPDVTGTGTLPFAALFPVNFHLPGSVSPPDTYLDNARFPTLECRVGVGSVADMCTGGTASLSSVKVEVIAEQALGKLLNGGKTLKVFNLSERITASTTNHQIRLPVGNKYTRLHFRVVDNSGVLSDSILNNVRVKSGGAVFVGTLAEHIKQMGLDRYSVASTGYYVLDLITEGLKSEALDARGMSQLDLILDVTISTSATIQTVLEEFIEPIAA